MECADEGVRESDHAGALSSRMQTNSQGLFAGHRASHPRRLREAARDVGARDKASGTRLNRREILQALEDDVLEGAKALLGMVLVRGDRHARLVEVEAYRADDPGCHAFRGRTPRNEIMFGPAGFAYVYFNYGVHWMLNVTAHSHGDPAAVLVRAAEPLEGVDEMFARRPRARRPDDLLSGPGKLAAAFDITGKDYGINLFDARSDLRLEVGKAPKRILTGVRVGLAKGKGEELPWRFVDANSLAWISRPIK